MKGKALPRLQASDDTEEGRMSSSMADVGVSDSPMISIRPGL